MRNKSYYHSRHPKTANEMRASFDGYARPKRRYRNLAHSYDDRPISDTPKSWKSKRKTQYREETRGIKHELYFDHLSYRLSWEVEEYMRDHNIPYHVETIRETYVREYWIKTKRVKWMQVPRYTWAWNIEDRRLIGYEWTYRDVDLPREEWKKRTYKGSTVTGYRIVWWYNKDIGIDRVLRRIHY